MTQTTDKKIFFLNGTEYKVIKSSGRWYLEYYVLKGVTRLRKKVYAGINWIKNEDDRIAYAIELATKIENGTPIIKPKYVLLDTLEKYKPTYRKKTYQSKHTRIKIFVGWLETQSIKDCNVTTAVANDFILNLLDQGKANATVDSYIHTLSSIYKKLEYGNPFEKCIKVKVQSMSLMYFSPEQKLAIINCAAVRNRIVLMAVKIQYSCFIRPGELRQLKVNDINFSNNTISVRPEISKNWKYQHVSIPNYLVQEIKTFVKNKSFDSYLFGNGLVPLGINYFNNEHSKILQQLNIQGRYAFYSWKHTGVVDAVRAGINLKDLQLQLRHHSLDMVNEYLKNLGVLDSEDLRIKMPSL